MQSGSIFYSGKRIATMQNVTYRIITNDGQEVADSGVYNTDGVVLTEISCDTISPVGGLGVSIVKDAVEHRDVDLALGLFDGHIHELKECRAKTIEFTGEVASGKQTGRFEWHGPKPVIV